MENLERPLIAAREIRKHYGGIRALDGVSLEVLPAEIHALVGENGAGKSTLVKIMTGAATADEGRLEVGGHELTHLTPERAREHGVGAVYQEPSLVAELTVLENMFLGREIARPGMRGKIGMIARGTMARESEKALAALQIKLPSVRVPVAALSGGQKQAVAVARASMWSTTGILMDEPTAALGTRQSDVVCELIRRTADSGLGVMVISHDLPRILAIADRIIVLRHGMVALTGSPGEITRRDVVDAMVGYHERAGAPE